MDEWELGQVVRKELRLPKRELPDAVLGELWKRLDADGSGHVTVPEFSRFMREHGESHAAPSPSPEPQQRSANNAPAKTASPLRRHTEAPVPHRTPARRRSEVSPGRAAAPKSVSPSRRGSSNKAAVPRQADAKLSPSGGGIDASAHAAAEQRAAEAHDDAAIATLESSRAALGLPSIDGSPVAAEAPAPPASPTESPPPALALAPASPHAITKSGADEFARRPPHEWALVVMEFADHMAWNGAVATADLAAFLKGTPHAGLSASLADARAAGRYPDGAPHEVTVADLEDAVEAFVSERARKQQPLPRRKAQPSPAEQRQERREAQQRDREDRERAEQRRREAEVQQQDAHGQQQARALQAADRADDDRRRAQFASDRQRRRAMERMAVSRALRLLGSCFDAILRAARRNGPPGPSEVPVLPRVAAAAEAVAEAAFSSTGAAAAPPLPAAPELASRSAPSTERRAPLPAGRNWPRLVPDPPAGPVLTFERPLRHTLSAGGADADFALRPHEVLELRTVSGAGRLLLLVLDERRGHAVVPPAVLFDSAATMGRRTATALKRALPALPGVRYALRVVPTVRLALPGARASGGGAGAEGAATVEVAGAIVARFSESEARPGGLARDGPGR